jgi:hypothetical protein
MCLLHREDNVCFRRVSHSKPACLELECNDGNIKWLLNIMKVKSVIMNTTISAKEKMKEDGIVNIVIGAATKGGRHLMQFGSIWRLQKKGRYSS